MKKLVNVAIMATLVIFATTAIFVGCKKEENKVVDKTQVVSKNQKNGINNFFEVENNPYFFVGDFHNQGLDFIIENINEETLLNLFDEEHIFDDEYILENESIFKDEILRYTKIFSESIGWESPIDIETEFCMINETIDLSMFLFEDQIERWNNLLSAVFEGDEEKSIHEVELLCSDFNDYVNNEVGNEEQQAALYAASSVLLSSYAYWFNEFNKGSNSLWFKYNFYIFAIFIVMFNYSTYYFFYNRNHFQTYSPPPNSTFSNTISI